MCEEAAYGGIIVLLQPQGLEVWMTWASPTKCFRHAVQQGQTLRWILARWLEAVPLTPPEPVAEVQLRHIGEEEEDEEDVGRARLCSIRVMRGHANTAEQSDWKNRLYRAFSAD